MHDVLIIGGGIIGLSIAYEAARGGQSVVILERGEPGREASWAGAGIIPAGGAGSSSPIHRLQAAANRIWPDLSAELREVTGIDNGYVRCGGIAFAGDEAELADQMQEWQRSGVAYESLDGNSLKNCEPQVAVAPHVRVCRVPEVAQVRNPRHLKALVSACRMRGVEIKPGELVVEVARTGSRVTGVRTTAGTHSAGQYVIAAGPWSGPLLEQCGLQPQIAPVRGQIVLLSMPTPPFRHILECGPRYLVPRPDGRILIGSTEEWAGFNKVTTGAGVQGLLAFGTGLVPALTEARFERAWAGLRPHAARGRPFVGRVPGFENLLVAAGHFRGGLSLAPITGRIVAQLLRSERPELPIEELGLSPE